MNDSGTPKISIIVPVYNAEKYIKRCIDSILAQTFIDWELLLVDDGSSDRSGEICDAYVAIDDRIRVLHKDNGGVSSARQTGQNEASGEYTIHLDPDDWVESAMLDDLYITAKVNNADMVICDYIMDIQGKDLYISQQPSRTDANTVLCELFQQLHGSCCNKLVKRVCYIGKVNFPEGINCCEDLIWCVQVMQLVNIIAYLPKAYYHYTVTEDESQSKIVSKDRALQDLKMLIILEQQLDKNTDARNFMYRDIIPYIMKRAMKTMAFDKAYFKKNFQKYITYIIKSKTHSLALRLVCFLSAIGLYDVCKPLVKHMK